MSQTTTKTLLSIILAMLVHSPVATALPAIKNYTSVNPNNPDFGSGTVGWAYFCNDEHCSEGCGISVDMSNPGCLGEIGRKSV